MLLSFLEFIVQRWKYLLGGVIALVVVLFLIEVLFSQPSDERQQEVGGARSSETPVLSDVISSGTSVPLFSPTPTFAQEMNPLFDFLPAYTPSEATPEYLDDLFDPSPLLPFYHQEYGLESEQGIITATIYSADFERGKQLASNKLRELGGTLFTLEHVVWKHFPRSGLSPDGYAQYEQQLWKQLQVRLPYASDEFTIVEHDGVYIVRVRMEPFSEYQEEAREWFRARGVTDFSQLLLRWEDKTNPYVERSFWEHEG